MLFSVRELDAQHRPIWALPTVRVEEVESMKPATDYAAANVRCASIILMRPALYGAGMCAWARKILPDAPMQPGEVFSLDVVYLVNSEGKAEHTAISAPLCNRGEAPDGAAPPENQEMMVPGALGFGMCKVDL